MVVAGTDSGHPAAEDGASTDVERLLTDLGDAAHDDVVDQSGVEVVATRDGLQCLRGQVDGVPVLQFSVALPPWGAHGIHDYGCWH